MFPSMTTGPDTMTTQALLSGGDDDEVCERPWK
jgi:hypothetical protein